MGLRVRARCMLAVWSLTAATLACGRAQEVPTDSSAGRAYNPLAAALNGEAASGVEPATRGQAAAPGGEHTTLGQAAAESGETAVRAGAPLLEEAAYERFAGSTFSVEQIVRALGTSPLTDLRPVGTTSVVLRASLDAPFRAALKLATHERPLAPMIEAAAYRLSRCLGLTTVPPVVLRRLPVRSLEQALDARHRERWPELVQRVALGKDAEVEGAAIFWIEGLRDSPVASRDARQSVLQALLQGSAVAAGQQLMAAQLSDLIVFDLLLGNSDRWSGGNVQGDTTGQWLYIRDHDLSFAAQPPPEVEARLLAQLSQVERFSRGLVERVRALTPDSFEHEASKDPLLASRGQWLRERVLPGVIARRAKFLTHVHSLVQRYGVDAVLSFP